MSVELVIMKIKIKGENITDEVLSLIQADLNNQVIFSEIKNKYGLEEISMSFINVNDIK